jgi:DNA-binding LacI/PurR family transcriptional regulator
VSAYGKRYHGLLLFSAMEFSHQTTRATIADVALAGFDDAPLSRYLSPPLTTVRAPTAEAGYTAGQLLAPIETATAELVATLATDIVIRRWCGCEE